MLSTPAAALLCYLASSLGGVGDWPQWRGPGGNGVSPERNLPVHWSADENIAWKTPLSGVGSSSPIVSGGLVVVTSQAGRAPRRPGTHPSLAREQPELASRENPIGTDPDGPDQTIWLIVEAFDSETGRRRWERRVRAVGPFPELHEKHNLATPTPASDGEHIFAWFGTGQLLALDREGRLVWTRHLGVDYAPYDVNWGHGSSPVIHGDLLLLLCDHATASYLVALDKYTGRERWKASRGEKRVSYATPLVVSAGDRHEILVNSSERVDAYDADTGKLLWHVDGVRQTPVPSPVAHGGVVYLSRGYRGSPYMALTPGGRQDVLETHILWQAPTGASYVSSLVYDNGLLYMTNDVGVLTCADASTGERVWQTRLNGIFFASPVAADGKVYFVSETGETIVVKAGRSPEILARNDLGVRLIASPAISSGRILLRGDDTIFSIGKGRPASPDGR